MLIDKNVPVCLFIKDKSKEEILIALKDIKNNRIDKSALNISDNIEMSGKFNEFIPKDLLKKQYVDDFLNIKGLKDGLII